MVRNNQVASREGGYECLSTVSWDLKLGGGGLSATGSRPNFRM